MDNAAYLAETCAPRRTGRSTERSFRPARAKLFASVDPTLAVINEPKHITDVGAPDFVLQRDCPAHRKAYAELLKTDFRRMPSGESESTA